MKKMTIPSVCLLVSGNLGFEVLKDIFKTLYPISAVFTNKSSLSIVEFCEAKGLPFYVGNPRKGRARNFIDQIQSDVILSVNYLYLVEEDLIQHPNLYAINIHGSLLPKYRGRTPHVWAIINGERQAGITAHLIEKDVDSGAIIKQVKVEIEEDDTGADILDKYAILYPILVKQILEDVSKDRVVLRHQDASLATYFGKRTPEDGHISWNWSKERIRNWIRAQAKPYPGAFTFYEGRKLTVHKSMFSDLGFHYKNENGEILKVSDEGIHVKTPNGCLLLFDFEFEEPVEILQGKILR